MRGDQPFTGLTVRPFLVLVLLHVLVVGFFLLAKG
jgi:hypothetical protein